MAWLGLAKGRPAQYVIVADQPIGVVTLESLRRGSELGYWLRQAAWGQGYRTKAARAVVAEHFADGASELVSGLGFREVKRPVEMSKARRVETGLVHFTLTRANWAARLQPGGA